MSIEPELPPLDADAWSDRELVSLVRAADAIEGRNHAARVLAVARWAAHRRTGRVLGTADGRGGPGVDSRALADAVLDGIDEDFVSELARARNCGEVEALRLVREALLLTGPLAATWRRLNAGLLTVRQAQAVVDLLGDATPEIAAEVQRRVLPRSEGQTRSSS